MKRENKEKKTMYMMVGSPGAGKSTFCVNYLEECQRVNRDTLKTMEKCLKVAEQHMSQN